MKAPKGKGKQGDRKTIHEKVDTESSKNSSSE